MIAHILCHSKGKVHRGSRSAESRKASTREEMQERLTNYSRSPALAKIHEIDGKTLSAQLDLSASLNSSRP